MHKTLLNRYQMKLFVYYFIYLFASSNKVHLNYESSEAIGTRPISRYQSNNSTNENYPTVAKNTLNWYNINITSFLFKGTNSSIKLLQCIQ